MTIREWIESNAKEGANIAEVMEMVEKDSIAAIKTKEQVLSLMDRNSGNPAFIAASDSVVSKAVQAHDSKFKEETLPGLIKTERDNILKELNPDETPEQKEIRELKEWKAEQLKTQKKTQLENDLLVSAKEIYGNTPFDPQRIKRYSVYGEDAAAILAEDYKATQTAVNSSLEAEIKRLYGNNPQPNRGNDKTLSVTSEDYDRMSPEEQREFAKSKGKIIEE